MFKKLTSVLATVAVGASIVAQPAQASPAHIRLIDTLERAGVKVYNGANNELCAPRDGSVLMGFYHGGGNYIVLCTNNGTETTMQQTLVHEAVHAIQDCVGGGIQNTTLVPIGNWKQLVDHLSDSHVRDIVNLYPEAKWGLEVEARFLENNPVAVEDAVRKFCF